MKKIIKYQIICLFILFYNQGYSQIKWYKEYQNQSDEIKGHDLIELNNGHFLISGIYFSQYKGYGYLLEIDSLGNIINENKLTDSVNVSISLLNSISCNNKIYSVGYCIEDGLMGPKSNIYIRSTNNTGNNFWTKIISDSLKDYKSIKIQYQHNLLHVLSLKNVGDKYSKINIMTLDTLGNTFLDRDIVDSTYRYNTVYDFKVLPDSSYFILGYRNFLNALKPNKYDFWMLKISKAGNVVFSKSFDSTHVNGFTSLDYTHDGNLVTVGAAYFNYNCVNSNITKLDYQGNILFSKNYNIDRKTNETLNIVKELKSHDYIAGGYFGKIMQIRKFDTYGELLWTKVIGEKINGSLTNIIETNDNGFLITGNNYLVDNGTSTYYIFVLKLDSLGNFDFVSAINTITKTTESISLYPNPTNAIINIQALHPEEIKTISLFNINGSLINTYPYDSKSINLSEYANGNYYLKIQYQNSFETKKIIKL